MSKDLSISVLMDFYGDLLTQKQRDTLDLYYNKDFSLAEIAQDLDISRQGVRDFIKKGENQLIEYETKLKLVEKYNTISKKLSELEIIAAKSPNKSQITKIVGDVRSML